MKNSDLPTVIKMSCITGCFIGAAFAMAVILALHISPSRDYTPYKVNNITQEIEAKSSKIIDDINQVIDYYQIHKYGKGE